MSGYFYIQSGSNLCGIGYFGGYVTPLQNPDHTNILSRRHTQLFSQVVLYFTAHSQSFSNHVVAVMFSTLSRTAVVGSTVIGTWTSASSSMNGDSIGLIRQSTSTVVWSVTVSAGFNGGTFSAVMPNSPGSLYNFVYLRNGVDMGHSTSITCVLAPTAAPTVTPTQSPTDLSGEIYCTFFLFSLN